MTYVPQQYANPAGAVPLSAPLYGASLTDAVSRFFKKYATFTGRASRSEYWWWMLVSVLASIVLNIIMAIGSSASDTGSGSIVGVVLAVIWVLVVIVPSLALSVRRLHDANFSGWMLLLGLIPFAGGIIVLIFTLMGPRYEGQRFDVPGQHAGSWQ